MRSDWQNKLYFGDNLEILRDHVGDESVDLVYLDPPFNSKATYSVLFKEKNGTASADKVGARAPLPQPLVDRGKGASPTALSTGLSRIDHRPDARVGEQLHQ